MSDILNFSGNNRFLSNFYLYPVLYSGIIFPSNENAYQWAKGTGTEDPESKEMRRFFENVEIVKNGEVRLYKVYTPAEAKKAGRCLTLRPDWESVKEAVMLILCVNKFADEPMRSKLLSTGESELIEGNYWHDLYYGKCNCATHKGQGKNRLGEILMQVRDGLK